MPEKIALMFARVRKGGSLGKNNSETIDNLGRSKDAGVIDAFFVIDAGSPVKYADELRQKIILAGGGYDRQPLSGYGFYQRELFGWGYNRGAHFVYYLQGGSSLGPAPGLARPENMQVWQSAFKKDPAFDICIPDISIPNISNNTGAVGTIGAIDTPNIADILKSYARNRNRNLAVRRKAIPFFTQTYYQTVGKEKVAIKDVNHCIAALTNASLAGAKIGRVNIQLKKN